MSPIAERDVVWAYRRYYPLLYAKCRRMLRDAHEAQDVAQETFVKLWRQRMDLTDTQVVSGWLYTTSTRLAIDRLRRDRRVAEAGEEDRPDLAAPPDRIAQARDGLARVARALTPEALFLLLLWRLDGLEQAEIAEITGLGVRTVRRRLRDAQDALERLETEHD